MTELWVVVGLAAIVTLSILLGRATQREKTDAARDADQGKVLEAEAAADVTERVAKGAAVVKEIDDATKTTAPGTDSIGARWDRIDRMRDEDGGSPGGDSPSAVRDDETTTNTGREGGKGPRQ